MRIYESSGLLIPPKPRITFRYRFRTKKGFPDKRRKNPVIYTCKGKIGGVFVSYSAEDAYRRWLASIPVVTTKFGTGEVVYN